METREAAPEKARHFDVYISHADSDRAWVEELLLPRLKEAGIQPCVGLSDFEPGALILEELENAITRYPKTVLILSPDYLDYKWELIDKMPVLDPKAKMRKFIPVVVRPCELPLYIRTMISLDFTAPEKQPGEWKRLINVLIQSRDFELKTRTESESNRTVISPNEKWYKDPLLNHIERNLRMETAHWIQAGFSIPESQFSFTAIFFENQIEVLGRLETEVDSLCRQLQEKQLDVTAKTFQRNLKTILDLVLIRANQLAAVVGKESDHPLEITLDKTLLMLVNEVESIKAFLFEASIQGILHTERLDRLGSEYSIKLYNLLVSIQNLIKYSKIIRKQTVEEWKISQ